MTGFFEVVGLVAVVVICVAGIIAAIASFCYVRDSLARCLRHIEDCNITSKDIYSCLRALEEKRTNPEDK